MEGTIVIHDTCMWFSIFMAGAVLDPKIYGSSKNYGSLKMLYIQKICIHDVVCVHLRFLRKILKFERK
jgi:hypothetical protein